MTQAWMVAGLDPALSIAMTLLALLTVVSVSLLAYAVSILWPRLAARSTMQWRASRRAAKKAATGRLEHQG